MNHNNQVTIIVNSCDKYECAWVPFFQLFKINWPECEKFDIILNTEEKSFNCDFLKINTIPGGKDLTWSKRLKNILNNVKTEYILFFLEDFFLQDKVDNEMFDEAVNLIMSDKTIGYIGLKYEPNRVFKDKIELPETRFFSRDLLPESKLRIVAMSGLWRKDWLIQLLDDSEDAWQFERNASVRSKLYTYQVLEINNRNNIASPVFCYEDKIKFGYGITHGQWLPKNKELFDKYDIEVDYDTIGINYDLYEQANAKETGISISNKDKNLIELLYNLKKGIKRRKRG